MGVDKMGVDEMGVDEMGTYRFNHPVTHEKDQEQKLIPITLHLHNLLCASVLRFVPTFHTYLPLDRDKNFKEIDRVNKPYPIIVTGKQLTLGNIYL